MGYGPRDRAIYKIGLAPSPFLIADLLVHFCLGFSVPWRPRLRFTRQPKIIAMTANAMAEDKEACFVAGMDHYISKPLQLSVLLETLMLVSKEQYPVEINPL